MRPRGTNSTGGDIKARLSFEVTTRDDVEFCEPSIEGYCLELRTLEDRLAPLVFDLLAVLRDCGWFGWEAAFAGRGTMLRAGTWSNAPL